MRALCLLFIVFAVVQSGARAAELTAKEVASAQRIYVAKCAKCHRFYEPTNYAESDWLLWMEKMNRKSKLKEEPARLLTRYLGAYRAGLLPGKPHDKPKFPQGGPRTSSAPSPARAGPGGPLNAPRSGQTSPATDAPGR